MSHLAIWFYATVLSVEATYTFMQNDTPGWVLFGLAVFLLAMFGLIAWVEDAPDD